jgi:hypothetical protein
MPALKKVKRMGVVDRKPEGWEWQRCTRPGCRRKATVEVNHDRSGATYRCDKHLSHCEVLQRVRPGRGKGIARNRSDAYGGYLGWERVMVGEVSNA